MAALDPDIARELKRQLKAKKLAWEQAAYERGKAEVLAGLKAVAQLNGSAAKLLAGTPEPVSRSVPPSPVVVKSADPDPDDDETEPDDPDRTDLEPRPDAVVDAPHPDLHALADHLADPAVRVEDLRETRRAMQRGLVGRFGWKGAKAKQEMVAKLVEHARARAFEARLAEQGIEGDEAQQMRVAAGLEKESEPVDEPTPPRETPADQRELEGVHPPAPGDRQEYADTGAQAQEREDAAQDKRDRMQEWEQRTGSVAASEAKRRAQERLASGKPNPAGQGRTGAQEGVAEPESMKPIAEKAPHEMTIDEHRSYFLATHGLQDTPYHREAADRSWRQATDEYHNSDPQVQARRARGLASVMDDWQTRQKYHAMPRVSGRGVNEDKDEYAAKVERARVLDTRRATRVDALTDLGLRQLKKVAAKEGIDVVAVQRNTNLIPLTAIANAVDHKRQIRAALTAGKPVPSEVLADYPDLAAKQSR